MRRGALAAALGLAVLAGILYVRAGGGRRMPPPPASPPPVPTAAMPKPAPRADPTVPEDLPTPAPGLDRQLAADYRKALRAQGIEVASLTIVDRRASGGARQAEIVYRTATDGSIAALRPEIARIVSPGANPRLALDRIVVKPIRTAGPLAVVTVGVADLDRWLKAQLDDAQFYARWSVQAPR
jgi:hypothetical protein